MQPVHETIHFVPADRLPVLPLTASLRQTFVVLSKNQRGGLIAVDDDLPMFYITAAYCGTTALKVALSSTWGAASLHTLRDVILESQSSENLTGPMQFSGVVPMQPRPVFETDDPEPLYSPEYRVYQVLDLNGRRTGWFLNHESLEDTTRTVPPKFRCVNGHDNAGMDSGFCSRCPGKLAGMA